MGFEIDASAREHQPIRVLMARIGLAGRDPELVSLARTLSESGIHVMHADQHMTPETVVALAAKEDVDVLYVTGAPDNNAKMFAELVSLMQSRGIDDIPVIAGGPVLERDSAGLIQIGVTEVLPRSTSHWVVVNAVRRLVS